MSNSFDFLRQITLFAELPDPDLEQICRTTQEVRLRAGELLFEEGSPGTQAYIIQQGEIEIYKEAGGLQVQLSIRQPGEIIGEMSLLESSVRGASGRALTDSLLVVISKEEFDRILDNSPSIARIMLHTYTARLRSTQVLLNQSEKMAQLGTLTAGIAHELNNPAAAARRAAEQFKEAVQRQDRCTADLQALDLPLEQWQTLRRLAAAPEGGQNGASLDPLLRSDLESQFEDWLDEHGVEDGWELAPLLAEMGFHPEQFAREAGGFSPQILPAALRWVAGRRGLDNLAAEVAMAAGRISDIVRALKTYVYLDQSPVQNVDLREGLENTLLILRHKLGSGVEVARDYDPSVPAIQAYGSELNQVWTNLIDNAVDAMQGKGRLTLSTRFRDPWVVVDVADSGPGIPPEVQGKLFSPFFTTKPVGQGTGLGLNISYNIIRKHRGEVKVKSMPGETHFEVWLPVDLDSSREEKIIRRENEPRTEL